MKRDMKYYVSISGDKINENVNHAEDLTDALMHEYTNALYQDICIIASGSSLNAALSAELFMNCYSGVRITIMSPTDYMDFRKFQVANTFKVLISQSGCSTNMMEAATRMKSEGMQVITLTGNLNGDMKTVTDVMVEYGVGNETIDYVTLGFTTLVEFLMIFAARIGLQNKTITSEEYQAIRKDMAKCGKYNRRMYELSEKITEENYDTFFDMKQAILVGDGPNMGVVREAALKLQETLKIPAVYYENEEYIHGPNMQLTPEYVVFFVDTNPHHQRMQEVFEATKLVTKKAYMITNKGIEGEHVISIQADDVLNEMTPLFTVVPFQYIASDVTVKKNNFKCHPLFDAFEKTIHCKTDDYDEVMKRKQTLAEKGE